MPFHVVGACSNFCVYLSRTRTCFMSHTQHAQERARTVWRETLHTRLNSRLLQNVLHVARLPPPRLFSVPSRHASSTLRYDVWWRALVYFCVGLKQMEGVAERGSTSRVSPSIPQSVSPSIAPSFYFPRVLLLCRIMGASRVTMLSRVQYWLFRSWDLKFPPGLTLLTFMATHIFHVSFASACGHGKNQTSSTGTVISSFVCFLQVLDSRRTSSRNMCS